MRVVVTVFCLFLMSTSVYSQTPISKDPPVYDKKFWAVAGSFIGSRIIFTEIAVHGSLNNHFDARLKTYTAAGICDFLVLAASANLKSDDNKWWWILPTAVSAVNGGLAIKYSISF